MAEAFDRHVFITGLELIAFFGTFQLYGQLFNSVLLAFVVVTGIGCAGLWAMDQLSTGTGLALGVWTFFIIQYASVLGAENNGVETGMFGLSFGVLVFLSMGTFVIYYNIRNPFYENRSDESVDMDEWPGKDDDEW